VPALTLEAKSKGALAYLALAGEVVRRMEARDRPHASVAPDQSPASVPPEQPSAPVTPEQPPASTAPEQPRDQPEQTP
jgi:hypothetical protein